PRVARREIFCREDVSDVTDAGAEQEAGGDNAGGHPRFEAPNGGIDAGETEPEIGNPNLILERAGGPADRGGGLLRKEHVADEGPQALHAEREQEYIAQQPVDREAWQDRTRFAPNRHARASERRHPQQNGNQRYLRHRDKPPQPVIATPPRQSLPVNLSTGVRLALMLGHRRLIHGFELVDQALDPLN